MEHNFAANTETARVLTEDELNIVSGGVVTIERWTSPLAIRGFNPQPDPPAFAAAVRSG